MDKINYTNRINRKDRRCYPYKTGSDGIRSYVNVVSKNDVLCY